MAETSGNGAPWYSTSGLLGTGVAAAFFLFFCSTIPEVTAGRAQRFALDWAPSLGVELSFYLDGLSLTFSLLISGIGILVMLYSAKYMAGHEQKARFFLFLTAFMLSMLGLVLADNLIGLFVFWELTTITSFLLIGFSHAIEASRRAAMQALLVTGVGALAMLVGFLLIGSITGSYELSAIRAMGDILRDSPFYLPVLILILAGAFTKSAQFPFHFWLPNAMAAPTPVSAYLHSATMVKGGVYLLARMHPSLSGTDLWLWSLTIFGAVTAVFASVAALRQTDLKQTLAYTTLMALGTLVMVLGAPGPYAITGAATFLMVHSFYKAALFLTIGCVDYETSTRDADLLGGIGKKMPATALAGALAAMSMAGLPPFLGFIAKELLYEGGLSSSASVIFVVGATLLASALMIAVAGIVAFKPFWGSERNLPERNVPMREAPWQMLTGPLLLGALGLVCGLAPGWLEHNVIAPTVGSILGDPAQVKGLHLWAGVNTALMLSAATFLLGAVLYVFHQPLRRGLIRLEAAGFSFDRLWDRLLAIIVRFCTWQTSLLQSGILKRYMVIVFSTILILLAISYWRAGIYFDVPASPVLSLKQYVAFVLIVAGTLMTGFTRSRFAAITSLGVVGIGVALVFIVYGAPDLAITQLLVEVLIVVLFAVAALRLPLLPTRQQQARRLGDAALSIAIGVVVALILLAVTTGTLDLRLTEFFESASYPEAHGRNIVNVILVDFRAFDTFGEITVVVIAALSAIALLRQRAHKDRGS